MTRYLDSSVVVNLLAGGSQAVAWDRQEPVCASRLLGVEVRRTLLRIHAARQMTDLQFADAAASLSLVEQVATLVDLSAAVLTRASQAFPTPVRTLDAIHLATALLLRERRFPGLVFATHDRQLALAARALEFVVDGAG